MLFCFIHSNQFVQTSQAIIILADFSYFHLPDELDQMLTNLQTSSCWAAIKKAVNDLNLKKRFMQSQDDEAPLEKEIIQIVLKNRLVSAQAHSEDQLCILIHRFKTLD